MISTISRVVPVEERFTFQSPEEFEKKAREVVLAWVPQLKGKSFYVRLNRRGFKDQLSAQDEERYLGEALFHTLEEVGSPATVTFDDPEAVVVIETVSNQAGASLLTRDEMQRYPFLQPD